MTAKEEILARVAQGRPLGPGLPPVPSYGWPGTVRDNFIKALKGFDGQVVETASRSDALAWLEANAAADGPVVCSCLPDFKGSCTPADYPDPHRATDIDTTVAEGLMGVGETGSILVTDATFGGVPAVGVLCRHLVLLLSASKLQEGIHQAYAAMAEAAPSFAYASFFSGPSATADIEAVHVTGAQGPLSLVCLLYP